MYLYKDFITVKSVYKAISTKSLLSIFKYAIIACIMAMLIGCGDDVDDKEKEANSIDYYEMLYAKDKVNVQISLQNIAKNNVGMLIQRKQDKQSILNDNDIKVIALFPKECSMCMPTLIHLNNLLSRNKSLQVIVISDQAIHTSGYRDFPITFNTQIINLVDTNRKFEVLLDSIKRTLNIEIRDYKSPLFLLQDTHNVIVQSIEGAVLEEIFEQTVSQILMQEGSNKQDSKQDVQIPNNALSQTAPVSTPPINADKEE